MLSIGAIGSSGQGEYYLALAREDYYVAGGEPPGWWHGNGANSLGLVGSVHADAFRNLLRGFAPSREALIQNAGDADHQPGWDLTFSAPKSVSVLWALGEPEARNAIAQAHQRAVCRALDYLQEEAAWTRRGKGGHIREQAGLVIAAFDHGTSRAQDPQLHTHCVVLNVGTRTDGTTGTIESKPFYQHKMAAGALYRAELAAQVEQALGLCAQREKSWFELPAVPKPLVEEFSKRRQEVEAMLAERGLHSAQAAAVATLSTRQGKEHAPRETLFKNWQAVGQEQGFGQSEVSALVQKARHEVSTRYPEAEVDVILTNATSHLLQTSSYFSRTEFVRTAAEEAQGRGIGASALLTATDKYLAQNPEIVSLGRWVGEPRYTTREMLALEQTLLGRVEQAQQNDAHTILPETLSRVILSRPTLSEQQARALHHVTARDGSVQVVSGLAGTGKTQLLDAARDAWQREGLTVLGCALSGKAAQGLQEGAGIESRTLHRLLGETESAKLKLDRRTVVVVDEAGMVGTRQMARLVEATELAGAKLVLVGDARQLQPIEAGGPFGAIGERIGQSELTEIRRQRADWAREAVADVAFGKGQKALQAFAERGLVHVAEDRLQAMQTLVSHWKEYGLANRKETLIFAGSNVETTVLNRLAQQEQQQAGKLGERFVSVGSERVYMGDRVLFTRNSALYGVKNGQLATVERVDETRRTITARLDNNERVSIPLECYDHVRLGYAVTTHKGQGVTVENAFVLAGGAMQDRELSYVQVSRARSGTRIYTDRVEAGDTFTALARQMEMSRQKELATSVAERSIAAQELTL